MDIVLEEPSVPHWGYVWWHWGAGYLDWPGASRYTLHMQPVSSWHWRWMAADLVGLP